MGGTANKTVIQSESVNWSGDCEHVINARIQSRSSKLDNHIDTN